MKIQLESQNLCLTLDEARKLYDELKLIFKETTFYPVYVPPYEYSNEPNPYVPYSPTAQSENLKFKTVVTFSDEGLGEVSIRKNP